MDEEKPRSIGSIATRIVCTVIGLLLLYVLSYGPAGYFAQRFPRDQTLFFKVYEPLVSAAKGTPLGPPLTAYVVWWGQRGRNDFQDAYSKTPPATH